MRRNAQSVLTCGPAAVRLLVSIPMGLTGCLKLKRPITNEECSLNAAPRLAFTGTAGLLTTGCLRFGALPGCDRRETRPMYRRGLRPHGPSRSELDPRLRDRRRFLQ